MFAVFAVVVGMFILLGVCLPLGIIMWSLADAVDRWVCELPFFDGDEEEYF